MTKKITKIEPINSQEALQLGPKKRVCAYCRVSTDFIDQQNSFSAQMAYYTNFINQRDDWQYRGVYADQAKSGTKLEKRAAFLQMLDDCEAGQIDLIITKSLTRFARNTVDSIEVIRRLKALGIGVYFEKEQINSLSEKSEQMLTILSSLAQGESENISTNTKWSVQKRFQEGTFVLACPPYGYTKDEDGELIILPEEAKIVRHIFQAYLNGQGTHTIAKALAKAYQGEKWPDSGIQWILRNPVYTGDLLFQKTFTTEGVPFKRQANKGQRPQYLIQNNHEAIITREEAEKVQNILAYRRKQLKMTDSEKYLNRYGFTSKIICGECGSTFRRQKMATGKQNEQINWCCHGHIEDKSKCHSKAIHQEVIQKAFILMWNKLASNYADILLPLLASLKNLRIDQAQEAEIRVCTEEIMALTKQSHALTQAATKGHIDSALFIDKNNSLMQILAATKKKKSRLLASNGFSHEIIQTEQLIDLIRQNPNIIETYNEPLFLEAVDRIIIYPNQQITFRLKNVLELGQSKD